MKEYILYTDGSCVNNGYSNSVGGWCFIILAEDKRIVGYENNIKPTTSNRMELIAILNGLQYIQEQTNQYSVHLLSDSIYSVNILRSWAWKWKKQGWSRSAKIHQPPLNLDLIKPLFELYSQNTERISVKHIRGHKGEKYNELCDKVARKGASAIPDIDNYILVPYKHNQKASS